LSPAPRVMIYGTIRMVADRCLHTIYGRMIAVFYATKWTPGDEYVE